MISAPTLLRTEDAFRLRDRGSYVPLAKELRRVGAAPGEDVAEPFRRMAFNALISNVDDHPRNHALLARDTEWRRSVGYGLAPAGPVSLERRELAMKRGDAGRFANARNLLSQRARFLLEPGEAAAMRDAMQAQVASTWYATVRAAGVDERDCECIACAFASAEFRQQTQAQAWTRSQASGSQAHSLSRQERRFRAI